MADDIVKRLRDSEWEDVLHELAADEIERLRAEVKGYYNEAATAYEQRDAITRERDALRENYNPLWDRMNAASRDRDRQREARHAAECNLEAAHATVVRMREALEWLRHWRTKDHESIDCCIEHALGQAETCSVCHPHGNAALAGGAEPKYASDIEAGLREAGYGDAVPASASPNIAESNDRAHVWTWIRQRKWHMCDVCGVIRRADDRNPPCSGPVKVTTRDAAQPAAAPHASDCAVNNGPALPAGECDCQPMAKAFVEDVRRSRWLERDHIVCQLDPWDRHRCRFPECKCPLRHTTDCDKTLLPSNPRAICTCGADANNRYREIRVNADGTAYAPPSAPASASPKIAESNDRADAAPKCRLPTFKDCGVCMEYPFCGCGAQAWTDRIRVALLPYVRHTHPNCHDVKAPGSTERHGCLCGLADALAMPLVQPPAAPATEAKP